MPFASLLFELLVRICRLNTHRWQNYSFDTRKPLQDTIAASQVCSHWRFIILSAPELWRFAIDPCHPCASWRDLVLKRSEPLSIEFTDAVHASRVGRSVHDIQLQMQSGMHQRLRRYHIWLDYGTETILNHSPLWPSDPDSWPQLQRLCLFFHVDGSDSHPHGNLPAHFPGLATPLLERLSLTGFYMPDWNKLKTLGHTLTHLKIHRPPSRLCADRWIELVQNLPNLESFVLTFALEAFCNHPKSKERSTLGVKKFAFSDLLHFCPSFLDRIDLSTTVCRSSSITCLSHPQSDSEISEEDAMKAVLPHMKRLLSQIMIDNSSFRIRDSLIVIDSSLLGPAIHLRELGQTVITKHSQHFYVCFHRYAQLTEYHRPFVYPTLLDLVRTISTSVELAETCIDGRHPTFNWDHYFDVLVHCQNIRFMQGVSLSWWKWLCKRLTPAAGEATNDATKPLFPRL
ncbi:hypothetical protein AGABI2DRAFT_121410 [Agaricus bisporus var. bisporus H97]|uniref:hypothetical protein n=1 Tax=Agaricus bisporus var. bisporus (strain H97 / ATCC MYA-4626 / FGSC 10389) TaxID=936046 RepID=UPI00029F7AFF|nr:hypothetical protein AGABI2DRAFT_121410 [Agaricus bisporus var. bisporus H97]EKV44230.1 hypothetical protein AGABI2DRAFT_121410 [Agaricus bisporus var. bisporus H97]